MDTDYDILHRQELARNSHPHEEVVGKLADLHFDVDDLEILIQHVRGCPKCRQAFLSNIRAA
jgi:hypothetical protein